MKITAWVLLSFVLLAGCAKRDAEHGDIAVGLYGGMTGSTATWGQSTRKGAEMAMDEINQKGGLLGRRVKIIVEDDQGKPEEAQTVVTKLINHDHVVAVIGENSSSRSLAAAPVCQNNRIPMITPTSTNPKVTMIGDFIFRVCFIDPFQGLVMSRFAHDSLHAKRVAILRDVKNDYSVGLAEVFTKEFEKSGGVITGNVSYSEGDTDFSAQLTSLKEANPEALYVPGYYQEVGLIARQARKLGITVPLLGGDGWDSPKLWEIGGEALNDCYFSNPYSHDDPNPTVQTFVKAYGERYKEVPDGIAALSYDAAKILADAIQRAGSTEPEKLRNALASTSKFPGVTGSITIDSDRNPVKPAVVLRVKNNKFEYVETIKPE